MEYKYFVSFVAIIKGRPGLGNMFIDKNVPLDTETEIEMLEKMIAKVNNYEGVTILYYKEV